MKKTVDNDTLVFIVDVKANKPQGTQAGKEFFVVMTTVKQSAGEKAYVHLTPDYHPLDIANKIGPV